MVFLIMPPTLIEKIHYYLLIKYEILLSKHKSDCSDSRRDV